MKIKVVDMTYEQALAQPPQVHKKPKKPSLLFRTVLRAASAPDLLATHFHCEKIGMAQIKSDEPCLVLMNHSCFLDLKIAEAVLYPRPFNIVCTSDGFVGKEWLMRSVGCIPTRKFCSDAALVRDMLYCVRTLKTSVLLYPEASYSFDGTATPLPESIGKCVKALGVPVYAIGVPTVVDAATLTLDVLEEAGKSDVDPAALRGHETVMVTTRDIDAQIRELSRIIGYGIDLALQPLDFSELCALMG